MRLLLRKIALYLITVISISSLVIYISKKSFPDFFLGSNGTFYFVSHQYREISKKSNFKNIILGDSRGMAFLNPKKMGDNWLNLSIPGTSFFEGYLTIKRFSKINEIDTVLLFYGTDYYEATPWFNRITIPYNLPSYEELMQLEKLEKSCKKEMNDYTIDPNQIYKNQLYRRLNYYNFPVVYRETFLSSVKMMFEKSEFNFTEKQANELLDKNRGHMLFSEVDSCSNGVIGLNLKDRKFQPNSVTMAYLDSIVAIAKQKKCVLYLVIAPTNAASEIYLKNSVYRNSEIQYFNKLKSKYPSLRMKYDKLSLPNNCFSDQYHPNKRGFRVYNESFNLKNTQ